MRRNLDYMGRFTVPAGMRESVSLNPGDPVDVTLMEDGIFIKPIREEKDTISDYIEKLIVKNVNNQDIVGVLVNILDVIQEQKETKELN